MPHNEYNSSHNMKQVLCNLCLPMALLCLLKDIALLNERLLKKHFATLCKDALIRGGL